jgi:hypothetical protein
MASHGLSVVDGSREPCSVIICDIQYLRVFSQIYGECSSVG